MEKIKGIGKCKLIKHLLTRKKMHKTLKGKPKEMLDKDLKTINKKAIKVIKMCMSISVASLASNKPNTTKLMKALQIS